MEVEVLVNARQRRQDRKLWRYSIVVVAQNYGHYEEMWNWLKQRHTAKANRCGWRERIQAYGSDDEYRITWQFINEQDAMEFALRWV